MSPRKANPLTLEYILLGFLSQRPMHGYDLYKTVSTNQGISKIWLVKRSELYALLNKLEDEGLLFSSQVPADPYPLRREYRLTEAGVQAFQAWVEQPVTHVREFRQEFMARLYFALSAGKLPALELITHQKAVCQDWVGHLPGKDGDTYITLVNAYRESAIKSLIQWLEICEREIGG
jgi:PadR family transcriptional regulator, regulatory protein AphA